jgi:hypothetical protein
LSSSEAFLDVGLKVTATQPAIRGEKNVSRSKVAAENGIFPETKSIADYIVSPDSKSHVFLLLW